MAYLPGPKAKEGYKGSTHNFNTSFVTHVTGLHKPNFFANDDDYITNLLNMNGLYNRSDEGPNYSKTKELFARLIV